LLNIDEKILESRRDALKGELDKTIKRLQQIEVEEQQLKDRVGLLKGAYMEIIKLFKENPTSNRSSLKAE